MVHGSHGNISLRDVKLPALEESRSVNGGQVSRKKLIGSERRAASSDELFSGLSGGGAAAGSRKFGLGNAPLKTWSESKLHIRRNISHFHSCI